MSDENSKTLDKAAVQTLIKNVSEELHIPIDAYTRIVKSSFTQSEEDILNIQNSTESADYDTIQPLAHRLKGVYANLRLTPISEPAAIIDALSKEKTGIEEIKQLIARAKKAFDNIKDVF